MTDNGRGPEGRPEDEPSDDSVSDLSTDAVAPPPPIDYPPGIPWRLAVFLVMTVLIVVFAVQNTQDVGLRFLGWTSQLPLVIVILIAVVISIILDEILGGILKRRRMQRRREREELERLRKQI
jgi:uncharacterized integral membrane protein